MFILMNFYVIIELVRFLIKGLFYYGIIEIFWKRVIYILWKIVVSFF